MDTQSHMRVALALLLSLPATAHADDVLPANPPPQTTHTYVEGRLGALGVQPFGTTTETGRTSAVTAPASTRVA